MKKKIFAPILFVLPLLLTSCGNSSTLIDDGKSHKLDDGLVVYMDDGSYYYNYVRERKTLEFNEDNEEVWIRRNDKRTIEYRLDKKASEKRYQVKIIQEYVEDYFDDQDNVYEEVTLRTREFVYKVSNVVGMKYGISEGEMETVKYSFGGSRKMGTQETFEDADGVTGIYYPIINPYAEAVETQISEKGNCFERIMQAYKYNMKDRIYYSKDNNMNNGIFYLEAGVIMKAVIDENAEDYEEAKSKFLDQKTRRLTREEKIVEPQLMFSGGI